MKNIINYPLFIAALLCAVPISAAADEIISGRKHAELRLILSGDDFDLKLAVKSIARREKSDQELTDILAVKLWLACSKKSDIKFDTIAWLGKAIGASGQAKYANVIDHCLANISREKTLRHLYLAKDELKEGKPSANKPGEVDWEKYRRLVKKGPKSPARNKQTKRFEDLRLGKPLEEVYLELGMPDEIAAARVYVGKTGHLVRVGRSSHMLEFKYNGLGAVRFYSIKSDSRWLVQNVTSDRGLYWYEHAGSFIDIHKVMAEARGMELRTLAREFIRKEDQNIYIEKSIFVLMGKRLTASLDEQDQDTIDGLAFMCELLAYSHYSQFHPVLINVAQNATDSKLRRYADKYADKLEDSVNKLKASK